MANNRTLTSANAILMLTIAPVYPVAQRIKGFSTDDLTDAESIDTGETSMGIDGRLSAGYVPVAVRQNITLQADSESNDFFENWYLFELAQKEKLTAAGTLIIPATKRQYTMTRGFLRSYVPMPAARKTLQPRRFTLEWQSMIPTPYVTSLLSSLGL